jgi:hypothetical protein
LEQEQAGFDETWREFTVNYAENVAELAGTHKLVDRERMVKERLSFVAEHAGGTYDDPTGLLVASLKELAILWEVAAHAATAAVTTAAAAASAKTPAAQAEATTAARAAVAAAKAAEAGRYAAFDKLDAVGRAAAGLKPRATSEGASGSGSGGIPTSAEPTAEQTPPPFTPRTQTVRTEERAPPPTGAREASAAAAATTAAATRAPDRDTLIKKLHTFAADASEVMYDDITSWFASEFSGDFTALAAAAEGGDMKAQFALGLSSSISAEERVDWLGRAVGQGCLDALLYSGLVFVENVCGQNDEAELVVGKDMAMSDLQMPAASGSAAAQHAVGMLLYIFDCDSGSKSDFLDAARRIRKAARQGLDVVGPCKLNPVDP